MNGSIGVTINFGLSNSLSRTFATGTTLGAVLADPNLQAALGFGKNVVGKIDGVIQNNDHRLVDGDEIDLEVKANTKATPVWARVYTIPGIYYPRGVAYAA